MKIFGLVGKTLSHSFSATYFKSKFSQLGLHDCVYKNFEIQNIGELIDIIKNTPELIGLNITIPYKEAVIPFLDVLSPEAEAIGAVNTIKIIRANDSIELIGFNTDLYGFSQTLLPHLKPEHHSALILGTGGSAKMVGYFFKKIGVDYKFVSRSGEESEMLTTYKSLSFGDVRQSKIIVNCTPVGMYPKEAEKPELPYEAITPIHILYDLIYNPAETMFLKEGKMGLSTILNGQKMLELQADAAWEIWNN